MTIPAHRPKPQTRNPWLLGFRPAQHPRLRLLCFPYAGGNAGAYRSWSTALPPDIEVLGVQLPGRGTRFKEPLARRLAPVLDALVLQIEKLGDRPFAFFGHSMGALLCFEIAQDLRRRRAPMPTHLFVSGYRAPGLPDRSEHIHSLPDGEFLTALRRYGGMPCSVLEQPELLELVLPVIRADFELVETWTERQHSPLDVPIAAFGGDNDVNATPQEIAAWSVHTRGQFGTHTLAGDHFFLHSAETALLDKLRSALA